MLYTVYILYSRKLNRFYVGYTKNLQIRLTQHNNHESHYTSTGVPWILVWSATKDSFRQAEVLETKLKNLTKARKLKFMMKYCDGLVSRDILDCTD